MEKLVRTEIYALDDEQMTAKLEESILQFEEELAGINDVEALKKLEGDLMVEFDEYDEHIKNVKYRLEEFVEYDGTKQSANEIQRNIIYFLNKIESEFRTTLGIYQMIRYWKKNTDLEIPYQVYESTLRTLGTLKYKGEQEMLNILITNNWFATAHEAYKKDAMWQGYLSTLHNDILKRMQELTGVEPE